MKALIVGGGIGGLSAAIGLKRAGIDAEVYERSKELGTPGGGLHVWSNATNALTKAALGDEVHSIGVVVERTIFGTSAGKIVTDWPTGDVGRKVGAPTIGTTRPFVHKMLANAVPEGMVNLGAECTGFEQDPEGVTVRFADGREARGDVLIGADGTNSVVRAQLHGREDPKYSGDTSWRAIVDDFEHPLTPTDVLHIYWGQGCRIAFYYVAPTRLYWIGYDRTPQGGRDPEGGHKDAVIGVFGKFCDPWPEIFAATDESRIMRTDIVDRDPLRRWGEGRVTLVGDAAHPMSPNLGQGACQAIEDGFIVAKCLGDESSPAAALRRYEKSRRGRTARMVRLSRLMARVGSIDGTVQGLARNAIWSGLQPIIRRAADSDLAYEF